MTTTTNPVHVTATADDDAADTERRGEFAHPASAGRMRIGVIVLGSVTAGVVAAVLLVLAPFGTATQSAVIGSVLCGFALGSAVLALLSARFTDQPQRWALAPALLMGVSGLLLVCFGAPVQRVSNWVWPPVMLTLSIWMIVRIRRDLRGTRSRWVLYAISSLLAVASVGGGFQTVGEAVDAQVTSMPGTLIDVGDHSLHLSCSGSGESTVVLEAGGSAKASDLEQLSTAVARDARVCVYDRAGRGWSEAAATSAHGAQIATDLHTLLHRAQIPGPYVLAGHSFGGLYVQMFAAQFPDEVAGMVLIDSTAPDARASGYAERPFVLNRAFALVSASTGLGLSHLFGVTARDVLSSIEEYADAGDAVRHAASLVDFGNKPLFVVTAGSGSDAAWVAAQDRMAALSSNSAHITVDGADHVALVSEQDAAATTARAILDVVEAVRSGAPLAE